jgi:hypothetical protein
MEGVENGVEFPGCGALAGGEGIQQCSQRVRNELFGHGMTKVEGVVGNEAILEIG